MINRWEQTDAVTVASKGVRFGGMLWAYGVTVACQGSLVWFYDLTFSREVLSYGRDLCCTLTPSDVSLRKDHSAKLF